MSYIILRGSLCHIIVLNVHVPIKDKIDIVKGSFYEDSGWMLHKVLKYHIKIVLGDFNVKVDEEDILTHN
jgi:hypothetical protein